MTDAKVSKADMGREGKLERLAEFGENRLLHKLEECAIRCFAIKIHNRTLIHMKETTGILSINYCETQSPASTG